MKKNRLSKTLLALLFLTFADHARAHDPGLSSLEIRIEADRLQAALTLARQDAESLLAIDRDRDGRISPEEISAARPALLDLAASALLVRLDNEVSSPLSTGADVDEANNVVLAAAYGRSAGGRIFIRSALVSKAPRGHRQYFSVHDRRGTLLSDGVLGGGTDSFEIDPAGAAPAPTALESFRQFLFLGIEHILAGYDHLLFLLGLFLGGMTLLSAAKIITSFTVAHSITLGLAALGVVSLPAAIVEPLIAASIVYVGVENLLRRNHGRRWVLTFAFGLVHGFGFATALREIGLGSNTIVSLLAFNLGVELGQIAIAAIVLPILRFSTRSPLFVKRYSPAFSIMTALIGGYWLIERLGGF